MKYLSILLLILLATSCGSNNTLESRKSLLKEKKIALEKLNAEIRILEKEIDEAGNTKKDKTTGTLVTIINLSTDNFTSYIEVQGTVKADNNMILTAESMGIIRTMNVTEGQAVGAGQVIAIQDNDVIQKTIAEIKGSLELADVVFKKQQALWEQKVGTELQFLQAKNNKEGLEKRLQTLESQMRSSSIIAPFSGIVEELFMKKGQNAMPGAPILRLVSTSQVKVLADVSESYLNKVKQGDAVKVYFPSLEKEMDGTIALIGQTINPENRTFKAEIWLANNNGQLKPDLLARVRLKNYEKTQATVIPTNIIQKDKAGLFVFVVDEKNGKTIAKKIRLKTGDTYKNRTEIKEGLQGTEKLVDEGFREVTEGEEVKIIQQ
ncbi:MAG: efflux RND transporter periplasmic adaptor subunit [Cytophagia bacterium]|nr:MAG: efflux RND transporter periplasmic adaptor subunit [Cytophagia bacterium]TAH29673.1 MAG: efflux RND transporter periplasmic adaptor subunit [Cytophagales bacterium]